MSVHVFRVNALYILPVSLSIWYWIAIYLSYVLRSGHRNPLRSRLSSTKSRIRVRVANFWSPRFQISPLVLRNRFDVVVVNFLSPPPCFSLAGIFSGPQWRIQRYLLINTMFLPFLLLYVFLRSLYLFGFGYYKFLLIYLFYHHSIQKLINTFEDYI